MHLCNKLSYNFSNTSTQTRFRYSASPFMAAFGFISFITVGLTEEFNKLVISEYQIMPYSITHTEKSYSNIEGWKHYKTSTPNSRNSFSTQLPSEILNYYYYYLELNS
jgi:hypothetical protein